MNGWMKILFALIALGSSTSALASLPKQYLVDLKVFMGGKLVSHPRLVLNAGTKGEVSDLNEKTGKGQFIEVAAHPVPDVPDHAFLQLAIGRIEKGGKRVLVGTPQLSAMLKEEAVMEIEENGKQLYKVAAIVSRTDALPAANSPAKKALKKK